MVRSLLAFFILPFIYVSLSGFAPKEKKFEESLRPTMQGIYGSVKDLLGFYVDRGAFLAPENEKVISNSLGSLRKLSADIAKKTKSFDDELMVYGEHFQEDSNRAYESFKQGSKDHAYFYIEEIIDTCFSCHTSREARKNSTFASLSKAVDMSEVEPLILPKYYVLHRQFDKALDAYESYFDSHQLSLSEVLHFDPFLNYLIISIRAKHDIKRPLNLFGKLKKRDYPQIVKNDFEIWVASLQDIQKKSNVKPSLDLAQSWIDKGRQLMEYPRDQSGVVYYIEASRVLKTIISDGVKKADQEKARAAYMLGLTELVIGHPVLGLEAQRYLEKAIRTLPHSELAKEAFSLYEENLLFAYSGSAGLNIPDSEKVRLEDLRSLANNKR